MQETLLLAAKKFIIDNISYDNDPINEDMCDVMPDARPTPEAGELFIAIHPGGFRGRSFEHIESVHSINISPTIRIPVSPTDRVGIALVAQKYRGLEYLVWQIIDLIHNNYNLIIYADSLIDDFKNKWTEPLRFSNCPPPKVVGGDWFRGEQSSDCAISQTIAFNDALLCKWGEGQNPTTHIGGYPINFLINEGLVDD